VGPTGQPPRSNQTKHSPPSFTLSLSWRHGDRVVVTVASVSWPYPAIAGESPPPQDPPPSTWPSHQRIRDGVLGRALRTPYGSSRVSTMRRWTPMSSGPPWLSSSPTSRRGVLGHWSSGSGELLHVDLGHYHCVLPLLPLLELGSTMGQGSNTSSSPLLCSTATLAFPLISPLDFPNLGN
jgi:hypothetical protein